MSANGPEIDLEGPDPLYEQIAAALKKGIEDGTYPPNRRIPSESVLADRFGVSRPTVRAGIKVLAEQGLVRSRQGRGTFVVPQTDT